MKPRRLVALALLPLLGSCASIVSKSKYPVSIQSHPSGLEFDVIAKDGRAVHHGKTPEIVTLDADAGFFQRAKYTVQFRKDVARATDVQLDASLDPWYFGNIIFGGLIGILIVDPLTGAMWKLPNELVANCGTPVASP